MNAFAFFDESFSLRIAQTLLHSVWQGCVVGCIVVIAGQTLKRASANARYAFNLSAMLVMVACLPVTFMLVDGQRFLSGKSKAKTTQLAAQRGDVDEVASTLRVPLAGVSEVDASSAQSLTESTLDDAFDSGRGDMAGELHSHASNFEDGKTDGAWTWLSAVAAYISAAYLAGVVLMMIRLAVGLWGGQRLRATAIPVESDELLTIVRNQAHAIGLWAVPVVAYCQQISIPIVVGIVKPMVLCPAGLASGLSTDHLQALITHELAHIRRFDLLVNLLQRMVEAILFFHPAVWFISGRISTERENAADDIVLKAGWKPLHYADALVRMAEFSSSLRNSGIADQTLALAASGAGASEFKRRIIRLIASEERQRLQLTRSGTMAFVFLVALAAFAPLLLHAWSQPHESQTDGQVADVSSTSNSSASVVDTLKPTQVRHIETDIAFEAQDISDTVPIGEHVDIDGDPLPEGAIARLGTLRFRTNSLWGGKFMSFVPRQAVLVGPAFRSDVGVWNALDGKLIRQLRLPGYMQEAVAVSPDGRQIATLAYQQRESRLYNTRVHLWNLQDGKHLFEMKWSEPLAEKSMSIAFSADGQSVVTGTRDGKVRVWDLASRQEVLSHQAVKGEVSSLAFSRDGQWMGIAGSQEVALWRWLEGIEPERLLKRSDGHRGASSVAFSPDGKWFATASSERNGIRVWDLATRQLKWRIESSKQGRYNSSRIEFTPDSRMLVVPVSQQGQRVELRSSATGRLVRSLDASGVDVLQAAVSADQQYVAGFDGHHAIHVWRMNDGVPLHEKFVGHDDEVYLMAFTPDGRQLVTAPYRSTMRIWDAESGKQLREIKHEARAIADLAVSPDGKYLGATAYDSTSRVWRLDSGHEVYKLAGHARGGTFRAQAVGFSPDARRFLSFGQDMFLRMWEVRNAKAIAEHDIRPKGAGFERLDNGEISRRRGLGSSTSRPKVQRAAFTPDHRHLLVQLPQSLIVFETETGNEIRSLDGRLGSFDVSSDGERFAAANSSADGQWGVVLRDFTTFEVTGRIEFSGPITNVRFSPSGDRIAATVGQRLDNEAYRHFVSIYDIETKDRVQIESENPPMAIAFSPDGRRLAASYDDTTVLIWDLAQFQTEGR